MRTCAVFRAPWMIMVLVLCFGVIPFEGWAQGTGDGSLSKNKKNLEKVSKKLQDARQKKKKAVSQERSILSQLEGFDRRLQGKRREVREIKKKSKRFG